MTTIHYVSFAGETTTVDAPDGISVMQAALNHNVRGIFAECAGQGECATCHVYIDKDQLDLLAPPDFDEDEMLEATATERCENSRLSCQIMISPALDGLIAQLPEFQR